MHICYNTSILPDDMTEYEQISRREEVKTVPSQWTYSLASGIVENPFKQKTGIDVPFADYTKGDTSAILGIVDFDSLLSKTSEEQIQVVQIEALTKTITAPPTINQGRAILEQGISVNQKASVMAIVCQNQDGSRSFLVTAQRGSKAKLYKRKRFWYRYFKG